MSDEYVSELKFPVEYTNEPSDKLLTRANDNISVRLRAKGGDIFSLKFFSGRDPIKVNLRQAEIKKSRYFDKYYVNTNAITEVLSKSFDFPHDIISIDPDTLFLEFEDIITKSLPVRPVIDINCKAQFQVYDSLVIIPDIINVSGPSSIIDTLEFIYSESKSFSDVDKNLETMIPLSFPVLDDKISYSENEVKLIIPIEKYTESSIDLPVFGSSNESGSSVKTFPETVQLTYQVAIKDYNLVKADMFHLSVIYDSEKDKTKSFLKVKVDKSPDFIKITRINPDRLEFLIQK